MTDDFFISLGKGINDIIRGISGVPQSIYVRNSEPQQIVQQKAPCTNCGQQNQIVEQQKSVIKEEDHGIQFNGGPALIARQRNKVQEQTNDNYINNEIHFS